jgi:adenylate cyclase
MGFAIGALAALGEVERVKEWTERALLLDPDNLNLRYNIACALVVELHEFEAALDLLGPTLEKLQIEAVNAVPLDPDLALIRDHPRFKAMVAASKARLAQGARRPGSVGSK